MVELLLFSILSLGSCSNAQKLANSQLDLTISPLKASVDYGSEYATANFHAALENSLGNISPSSLAIRNANTANKAAVQSLYGSNYYIPLQFGAQNFKALVDTGASDTWIASKNLTCINSKGKTVPLTTCRFPTLYQGPFQHGQIKDENFYVNLGFGEFVKGPVGYMDVTVAGLTVEKQEAALVTEANFNGLGIGSGIMGLAYPAQTQVFHGTNTKNDTGKNHAEYLPIFSRMFSDGLIECNLFSMALNRGNSSVDGGFVSFGGLPPVPFNKTNYGQTRIHIADLFGSAPAKTHFSVYTIIPKAFGLTGNLTENNAYFFIDSGTPGIYLPSDTAAAVAQAFKPPAQLASGAYLADCNSVPPKINIQIGDVEVAISPQDLIFRRQHVPGTGKCLTGIYDGGNGPFILGDVFLTNIVAVFDVGSANSVQGVPARILDSV